jgi:hypothetical protein
VIGASLAASPTLRYSSPIELIGIGGVVAVWLDARNETGDINYLLDPTVLHHREIKQLLKDAIETVAGIHRYHPNWANDYVGPFPQGFATKDLFAHSIDMDEVVYRGEHLVIYAAN